MAETFGNMGLILKLDMTSLSSTTEDATPLYKKYLGGRSLNHYLLLRDVNVAKVQAFDPENELIFGVGPLGGTLFPSSGRYQVTFIAPLTTSGLGDANSGGAVGPAIKYCGYDTVIVKGKAAKPTYIVVENEKIEFLPADDLWGKGCNDTTEILKARHGEGVEVMLIGPAGENLCKYANIRTKLTNSLGRSGGGAVMGSKNLKAIVFKGSKPVKIAEPEKFMELCNNLQKDIMDPNMGPIHGATYELMSKYGTPGLTRMIGQTGMVPIKNWQECGIWEKDEELDGPGLVSRWGMKRDACQGCPIHCHSIYHVEGKYATHGGGPEYETTCAFGHKCLVSDGAAVLKMNTLANDFGFDSVELANMFSTLMEWYDRGIIDASFTDGIPMTWSNADGVLELIPKIAVREGCGDELAKGPYWVGLDLGEEALKYVYHQKGMVATGVETRSTIGAMLSFAISNRGSHHLSGLPTAEWVNNPSVAIYVAGYEEAGDIQSYHPEAKSNLVRYYENLFELPDSLGICKFTYGHAGFWHDSVENMDKFWEYLVKGTSYATGIEYTKKDFEEIAERSWQMERALIAMRGMRRVDDMPNWRCQNEECPGDHPVGPIPLPPINMEKFNKVVDQYYQLRGWTNDGVPTRAKLEEVGLADLADMMERYV